MSDLRDLYQEVILDHTKRPRNFRAMTDANRTADGHNRLCGDKLKLFVKVEDGVIKDAAFQGSGCAISTASASMMTTPVRSPSQPATVDFPQPMGPVSPMLSIGPGR